MVDFLLEINDAGDTLQINDAADQLLILDDTILPPQGGSSLGGKAKKKKGYQLTDLGPRPHVLQKGESISQLVIKPINKSKSRLNITIFGESLYKAVPIVSIGASISKIVFQSENKSKSKLALKSSGQSWGVVHPSIRMEQMLKKTTGIQKALKALSYLNMLESLDDMYTPHKKKKKILEFSFDEQTHDEKLVAFTHSSSFVGNVRYDEDNESMRILLNGKKYNFCGVPRRVFDAFEGSTSKGSFFSIQIRGNFDC